MRRVSIYPHRSVRSVRITRARLVVYAGVALLLSLGVAFFGDELVNIHGQLSRLALELLRIPVEGTRQVEVFPVLGSAFVPETRAMAAEAGPPGTVHLVMFGLAAIALLVTYRFVELARGFVLFLLTLLLITLAVMYLNPGFGFTSLEFSTIWLRGEVLVWLLLPWLASLLLLPVSPSVASGVVLVVLVQAYALVWSAARLVFCLGVLYYTGSLFLPLLWFALGLLADVLYLCAFYSVAVRLACDRVWGRRALWQF